MRKRGKIDGNQNDIVEALRARGASVLSLASVGGGCPDLLVGIRDHNYLLEVKDGALPESKRRLTNAEMTFFLRWKGHEAIVHSVEEAIKAVFG